jgi:hypothetical protein
VSEKVIYILGAGRSGTTVIDIVLGNNEEIFSCGELVRYSELKAEPHGFPENSKNYIFWKNIEQKLFNRLSSSHEELFCLSRKMEFHPSFFLNLFKLTSRKNRQLYKEYINTFFGVLFDSIGQNIVIDSSKYAGRGLGLLRYLNYDLYLIYVIRDPVRVIKSFARTDVEQMPKNYWAANIYYFLVNFICRIVTLLAKKSRVYTLKYENFLANPAKELENIQKAFGIDLQKSIRIAGENGTFEVGFLFEGNRIRLKETIRLRSEPPLQKMGLKSLVTRACNIFWWH